MIYLAILIGLFVLGLFYNQGIAYLESRGMDRGYRGLLVLPLATIAIIAMVPIVGTTHAALTWGALMIAGLVPVGGDTWRAMKRQSQDEQQAGYNLQAVVTQLHSLIREVAALLRDLEQRGERIE